jgi:hypothetical protein
VVRAHGAIKKMTDFPRRQADSNLAAQLFAGGPRLEEWLRLVGPGERYVLRRAIVAAAIGWLPLLVLTLIAPGLPRAESMLSLWTDVAVVARSLIAAPLLIVAEVSCAPQLSAMAQHFSSSGLIAKSDEPRFALAVASTRRLLHAPQAGFVMLSSAYALVLALLTNPLVLPTWQRNDPSATLGQLSLAGWWHALVSVPLLLVLVFGWLWRLFLWGRFLWLMSRLDLQLVAAHPDLTAGLRFLGCSLRAFAPVGFAFGVVVAGTAANNILNRGQSPAQYGLAAAWLAAAVSVVFCAPLVFFFGKLLRTWEHAVLEYGGVADALGRTFQHEWLRGRPLDKSALSAEDFSSVADLSAVVSHVYEMRLVPIDLRSLLVLIGATLLPMVPIALVVLPAEVLVSVAKDLLF